jgi:hypothetical protein
MPYTRTYLDDGKGLLKTGTGFVTGAEILAVSLSDADDEAICRRLRYGLLDFSATTEMQVTAEDMRRVVEANRKIAALTGPGPVAIVAPSQMSFGLARMWHTLSEDFRWESSLFRNRPDAIAWLRQHVVSGGDQTLFPSLNAAAVSSTVEA